MRPLTISTPKPLLCVGSQSLLEHQIRKLIAAGVRDIVVNAAYLSEQIEAALGAMSLGNVRCKISLESEPLETGGGLLRALPMLGDDPFILVNADIWHDYDFSALSVYSLPGSVLAHLVLVPNPDHNLAGDFGIDRSGRCTIDQHEGDQRFTFSGVSLMRPELIEHYSRKRYKFPLVEALVEAMSKKVVTAEVHRGAWLDIGTEERLFAANSLYLNASDD